MYFEQKSPTAVDNKGNFPGPRPLSIFAEFPGDFPIQNPSKPPVHTQSPPTPVFNRFSNVIKPDKNEQSNNRIPSFAFKNNQKDNSKQLMKEITGLSNVISIYNIKLQKEYNIRDTAVQQMSAASSFGDRKLLDTASLRIEVANQRIKVLTNELHTFSKSLLSLRQVFAELPPDEDENVDEDNDWNHQDRPVTPESLHKSELKPETPKKCVDIHFQNDFSDNDSMPLISAKREIELPNQGSVNVKEDSAETKDAAKERRPSSLPCPPPVSQLSKILSGKYLNEQIPAGKELLSVDSTPMNQPRKIDDHQSEINMKNIQEIEVSIESFSQPTNPPNVPEKNQESNVSRRKIVEEENLKLSLATDPTSRDNNTASVRKKSVQFESKNLEINFGSPTSIYETDSAPTIASPVSNQALSPVAQKLPSIPLHIKESSVKSKEYLKNSDIPTPNVLEVKNIESQVSASNIHSEIYSQIRSQITELRLSLVSEFNLESVSKEVEESTYTEENWRINEKMVGMLFNVLDLLRKVECQSMLQKKMGKYPDSNEAALSDYGNDWNQVASVLITMASMLTVELEQLHVRGAPLSLANILSRTMSTLYGMVPELAKHQSEQVLPEKNGLLKPRAMSVPNHLEQLIKMQLQIDSLEAENTALKLGYKESSSRSAFESRRDSKDNLSNFGLNSILESGSVDQSKAPYLKSSPARRVRKVSATKPKTASLVAYGPPVRNRTTQGVRNDSLAKL